MNRGLHTCGRTFQAASESLSRAEVLERRVLLSTYLVTNTNDSGPGSLRQAILDATTGPVSIDIPVVQFNLGSGTHTIRPSSPLPVVTRDVRIGSGPTDLQPPPPPTVELDGSQAGPFASGLVLGSNATGARVLGLIINRFAKDGIDLQGTQQGIFNSHIGLDATGKTGAGNGQFGISVTGRATIVQNDVVSGNGASGILISGQSGSATITGSYIGTNAFGTAAVGNGVNPNSEYRDGITVLTSATIGTNFNQLTNGSPSNVISANHGNGIFVGANPGQVQITRNAIGTDVTGSLPLGNSGNGIELAERNGVVIGMAGTITSGQPFPTSYGGNVIAANGGDGILVYSSSNTISGNFIGANIVGAPMGNAGAGVEIRGGNSNKLDRDTIAGNGGAGVSIRTDPSFPDNPGGTGNIVQNCNIGITPRVTFGAGNAGNGVEVFASHNTIGMFESTGNVIGGNGGSGVYLGDADGVPTSANVVAGNLIGTTGREFNFQTFAGNAGDGITIYRSSNNSMLQNTIFDNGGNGVTIVDSGLGGATGNTIQNNEDANNAGLGIDLGDDGVTPNHPGGSTSGPNHFQNYPVVTSAKPAATGGFTVGYTLDAAPGSYMINFYNVSSPDPSGHGQAAYIAGQQTITVSAGPPQTYFMTLGSGGTITATATDSAGNTSEFSKDAPTTAPQVVGQPVFNNAAGTVTAQFTQDVSASLMPSSLSIISVSTGQPVNPTGVSYDPTTNTATFTLPHPLPAGTYAARLLSSGISNNLGNPLLNAQGTHDFRFTFSVASPDLNQDHVVNFKDLVILAAHYGQSGTSADGDLNGDGMVNLADLVLLAQSYGQQT